jgi:hypothetical protein
MSQAEDPRLEKLKRALAAGAIDQETFEAAVAGIRAHFSGSGAVAQGAGDALGEAAIKVQPTTVPNP